MQEKQLLLWGYNVIVGSLVRAPTGADPHLPTFLLLHRCQTLVHEAKSLLELGRWYVYSTYYKGLGVRVTGLLSFL